MTAVATAEKAAVKATTNGEAPTAMLHTENNLHQRIAAISGEVKVQATGTTGKQAGDRRTISIGDVDEALGPLMAKHGVVSDYEFIDRPESYDQPTRDGTMKMWLVTITGYIYNADLPTDMLSRKLYDIGSNPSAAVSFALKRWKRALFKLVEDDDQQDDRSPAVGRSTDDGAIKPRANGQSKMSTAEQARIIRLNEQLPKPKGQPVMDAFLRDLPYDKALAQMTMEHGRQCPGDPDCAHVKGEA